MTSIEQGYAAVEAENFAEAARCFAQVLREDPDNAEAAAWLGQALCILGRRAEGIAHLRAAGQRYAALARASQDAAPLLYLIPEIQHWSDFDTALELGEIAAAIAPDAAQAHQLNTLSLSQLNRIPEAIAASERALALAPGNTMMQVLQASLLADDGRNAEARARLAAVLEAGAPPREAFHAHKELGRVLDKLRDYDGAFAALRASESLAAQLPEWQEQDLTTLPAMLRANQAGFDQALLRRWTPAQVADRHPAPVFVLGFMRSGTTLTQEVLGAHPDIFVSDEAGFIAELNGELHRRFVIGQGSAGKLRGLDAAGIRHLRDFYWRRVHERYGDVIGGRLFVDKFTMNTLDLGLINVIFPDARVIFVMRDPRDVVLSCYMQLMVPSPATAQMITWENTVGFYAQMMRWWMHVRGMLTLSYAELRYEDLVADFETSFRKIFELIGVEWNPVVAEFHKQAAGKYIATPSRTQVSQPLYSTSVARWRRYERHFAGAAPTLAPFLDAFGYEGF